MNKVIISVVILDAAYGGFSVKWVLTPDYLVTVRYLIEIIL